MSKSGGLGTLDGIFELEQRGKKSRLHRRNEPLIQALRVRRTGAYHPAVKFECVRADPVTFSGHGARFRWCRSSAGRPTQKESHVIQKSMEQSARIYIIHTIETYEENKKRFQYLTDQTGDPDMVRV